MKRWKKKIMRRMVMNRYEDEENERWVDMKMMRWRDGMNKKMRRLRNGRIRR